MKTVGAAGRAPVQKSEGPLAAWWARALAALWMLGVSAAHYWLWVRALIESVPAQR